MPKKFFNEITEFTLWNYSGHVGTEVHQHGNTNIYIFCSKNYPRTDVLIALQVHELFILFGKGINNISKF